MKDKQKISLAKKSRFITISVVLSLIVVAGGYIFFRYETELIRQEKQSDLKTIAGMKVEQLVQWHKERTSDAVVISQRNFFIERVEQWLSERNNDFLKEKIIEDLESIRQAYSYGASILASTEGELLLYTGRSSALMDPITTKMIIEMIENPQIKHTDFYYCEAHKQIHYDVVTPLIKEENKALAFVILRSDPDTFLYPMIQSWPLPRKSAETLIVRREGESVLFLNELQHRKNTALKLRIPLTEKQVPAVRAALGYSGVFEGIDYRGEKVLADMRSVPGTSWFMISKIDKKEIFKEIYSRSFYIILFIILLILIVVASISLIYSNRQKNIYRKLWLSQEEFKITLYSIGDAVITTDRQGKVKHINPVAEKLTGWKETEAREKEIEEAFNIINEETRERVESPVERVLREGLVIGLANHSVLISRDGKEIPIADSGAPIKDESGKIIGVVLVFRDQTEERKKQKAVVESRRRLSTLMSNLPGMAYRCKNDPDWTMEFVSEGCHNLTGYWTDELLNNRVISYGELIHPDDRQNVWEMVQKAVEEKSKFQLEYRIVSRDKKIKWVWEQGEGVFPENGELEALEGFITNITLRKQSEEQIKKQLKEKEILLRELYHRTKNNMQLISAMLRLRARRLEDEHIKELFKEIESKVISMAVVHQKLYESRDLFLLNLKDYFISLVNLLKQTYRFPGKEIELEVRGDDLNVQIETALPLGLVINELVSNSMKYAFVEQNKGKIEIVLKKTDKGELIIEFSDNGIGLPESFDAKKEANLGLETVFALVENQLQGKIEVSSRNGLYYRIALKEKPLQPVE